MTHIIVGIGAAAAACGLAVTPVSAHDPGTEQAFAQGLLDEQMAAWNRGDLESVLYSYCPSDDTAWVNRAGVSRGFESYAKSMRAMFGGGPGKMGTLRIDLVDHRLLGDGSSLMVVRWSIMDQGKRRMGGISTQLWSECDGRMRVVFEHGT